MHTVTLKPWYLGLSGRPIVCCSTQGFPTQSMGREEREPSSPEVPIENRRQKGSPALSGLGIRECCYSSPIQRVSCQLL
jgi:hypothetical protein